MISIDEFYRFVNNNHSLIDNIKLTSIKKIGFNNMEGREWQANYKIITVDGYKNKLLKVYFNDTFLDEDTPQQFAEYLTYI